MARPKRRKDHTPLDAKLQALHEQQEKLRGLMEENQRLIDEAPGIAKQQESNRRKEVMSRDSHVFTKLNTSIAMDSRSGFGGNSRSKPLRKKTRRERHEVRTKCLFLVVLLLCLLGWLYHMLW